MELTYRFATLPDLDLYYKWVNNPLVRQNSFHQDIISYEDHVKWFHSKINSGTCFLYLFFDKASVPVGQVRIEKSAETIVDVSIDQDYRGKSLSSKILALACDDFLSKFPPEIIYAYIKSSNQASYKAFLKTGFIVDAQQADKNFYKLMMVAKNANTRKLLRSFENKETPFQILRLDNFNAVDTEKYLALFYSCFGKRTALDQTWFNWFFTGNPYGLCNNYILLDKNEDKFVGAYALSKSVIKTGEKHIRTGVGVNGMVHPDYRNRGLYAEIIKTAVEHDDMENLAVTYLHGSNRGTILGHVNAGWRILKKMPFYATKNVNGFNIDKSVKEIASIKDIKNADKVTTVTNYHTYAEKSGSWLDWRFFMRPHKKYNVIGFFESPGIISGYMVLGYYKNDVVSRCQVLDYNAANDEVLNALLNSAKCIAQNNQCSIVDLWLDEYSKELSFFEKNEFFKTEEHYELLYITKENNDLDINIKTVLADLDAV